MTQTTAAGGTTPGRVAPPRVASALYVDLGEGHEIKHGARAGQLHWDRPPRARFERLLCGTKEGPVFGVEDVTAFAATIRTEHPARCSAHQEIRK